MPESPSVDLSELTLVIPSFERQRYLIRQMNYWRDQNISLLVLDGSRFPLDYRGQLAFGNEPTCICYFHLPVSIEERLGFAVGKIKTKYAALLSDDEFFLPSALRSCIEYLDSHADTVCCKGRALGFAWRDGRPMARDVYPDIASCQVNSSDPEQRLLQHFSPYQMISLWSVSRVDIFLKSIQAISYSGKYKTAAAAEMQISLISAYSGKCKVIDELMWMRSFENKNIWWDYGNLSFVEWYRDPRNICEHRRFFDSIYFALGLQNCSRLDSLGPFRDALEAYCRNNRKPRKVSFAFRVCQMALRIASRLLPFRHSSWKSFGGFIRSVEAQGIKISRRDMDRIELYIALYNQLF